MKFLLIFIGAMGRGRLILHSIIGAASIGTLLSLLLTIHVYPKALRAFIHVYIDKAKFSSFKEGLLPCFLGCITHVFLDALHHNYNPLLYPFTAESFDFFVLFGEYIYATITIQTIFITLFTTIIIREAKLGIDGILKRLLIN